MRRRVVQAFSGNNSGSYVLVGTFEDVAAADVLRAELAEAFDAQAKWLATQTDRRGETAPLAELARKNGMEVDPRVGAGEDWPHHGSPPAVGLVGHELLVFVDYAVTFPRFLGELVYRRGGRVSVEVNHGHHALISVHEIWFPDGWKNKDEAQRALDGLRAAIEDGALASLYESSTRSSGPPVLRTGFWPGSVLLLHSPADPVAGAAAVQSLAASFGLSQRISLFETPVDGDPLRAFRALDLAPGDHQTILWRAGPDVVATVRAVRAVTGQTLEEARELVARAPIEVLKNVSEREATVALEALLAAGAEAELLGPQHFAPSPGG